MRPAEMRAKRLPFTPDPRTLQRTLSRVRRVLLGRNLSDGWLFLAVVYALLISIGFIYLYPLLFMLSQSAKSLADLLDPTVIWIPRGIYLDNFVKAWNVLQYPRTLAITVLHAALPALAQMISCAVVGYGFARFRFPGKSLFFAAMLAAFIIPVQVIMIPLFLMFKKYGMLGTPLPFIVPALLAGGLKSTLFILVFTQFFRTIPTALEEAAQLDGAGYWTIFLRIVLPLSGPALVVVFLFSFVWHWNETYLASLYFGNTMQTLTLKLQTFQDSFRKLYSTQMGPQGVSINESIIMAGTLLVVLPLLILYAFMQKWFVQVLDRTGIAGE